MSSSKRGSVGTLLVVGLAVFGYGCGTERDTQPREDGGAGAGSAGGSGVSAPNERLVEDQVVSLQHGRSAPFTFVAPADVLSLSVSAVGETSNRYWICDWASEDGFVLVPPGWEDLDENLYFCTTCNNRVRQSIGVTTAFAPNSSASRVSPGEHTLTICGESSSVPLDGNVHVTVTAKRGDAEPLSGVLDLNLFFTGAEGWTAETAPNDPVFVAELDEMAGIFGQSGITLGTITYLDLGEDHAVVSQDALAGIYRKLDASLPLAVNIVFFEHVEANPPFLALSGGIPGPYVRNTAVSGVAVSMRELHEQSADVSRIVAHEVGHFLGLYHATEVFLAEVGDPLDDTPLGDESNLMHAQPQGSFLSPEQGRVLRLNPFVHLRSD